MRVYFLTITNLIVFLFFVNGQSARQETSLKSEKMGLVKLKFDRSRTTIIPFRIWKDNGFHHDLTYFPFDSSYKSCGLTQKEIEDIDSLLILCADDFNNTSKNAPYWKGSIELKKYKYWKQIVVALNNKGEKEVWVNCLCMIPDFGDDDHYWLRRWKTRILTIVDGGTCFFNVKINLSTRKYYSLNVNGTG